jgi:hypothetical protein
MLGEFIKEVCIPVDLQRSIASKKYEDTFGKENAVLYEVFHAHVDKNHA